MGSIVQLWLGSHDGLAEHFGAAPFPRFSEWLLDRRDHHQDSVATDLLSLIERLRTEGMSALRAQTASEARLVDDLIQLYYGHFLSFNGGLLTRADESMLPERYFQSALLVLPDGISDGPNPTEFAFVLNGRPIERDPIWLPFSPSDPQFRVSFWTHGECALSRIPFDKLCRTTPPGEAREAFIATSRALGAALDADTGLIFTVG